MRLDIAANGGWFEQAFFDVRVFNLHAQGNRQHAAFLPHIVMNTTLLIIIIIMTRRPSSQANLERHKFNQERIRTVD